MENIFGSYSNVLYIAAILLTMMSCYTSLDLLALVRNSDRNRRFLFIGATVSMGIGIWLMNFIGMLAIDINLSVQFNIPITILSIVMGVSFTAISYYILAGTVVKNVNLFLSSLFITIAVLSIHSIGLFGLRMLFSYQLGIWMIASVLVMISFYFVFWLQFSNSTLTMRYHVWLKPISGLVLTAAIVEGHYLLSKASTVLNKNESVLTEPYHESFISYLVMFLSVLILFGLIASSAFVSRRLAISDSYAKDVAAALNESSIVAITDPKGRITYVNDKFIEISKFSRDELIGQDHRVLNSRYHPKEFFTELWREIASGTVWRGEIRNQAKDGSYYWVDTTIVPFLGTNGKPYQYVAIRHDITKRKDAEDNLSNSLKQVSDINFALDQSSIVAFTDEKGKITGVNDKFCEISKYSRNELIGQDHRILNSGYHSKEFFNHLWHTISHGKVWKGEIRNRAKDESLYWVDTTIVPFIKNGKVYQYLAIRNDITERKQTEEILQRQDKLAAVGQLAAGVAHEIRNPLTSMKGYGEFLLEDEMDPQRKEFLEIILDEINRVNTIVEDFMVLAKPKAVHLEEKNLVPIIQNVLSLLEFEAKKRNVTLRFDYYNEIILVECDEDRMKQVFLNFVKNGIEAMPNGGQIAIRVRVEDQQVQISIQDTGVGIPHEKLKRIGEPFYTTKKNGNGLGLMVSFKIIESHNGKVYIDSELNKGTTFNILLPARTA